MPEGYSSTLNVRFRYDNQGGFVASRQDTLDEQVLEMGSFSVNYELEAGPPCISVDEYAELCTEKFRELGRVCKL